MTPGSNKIFVLLSQFDQNSSIKQQKSPVSPFSRLKSLWTVLDVSSCVGANKIKRSSVEGQASEGAALSSVNASEPVQNKKITNNQQKDGKDWTCDEQLWWNLPFHSNMTEFSTFSHHILGLPNVRNSKNNLLLFCVLVSF